MKNKIPLKLGQLAIKLSRKRKPKCESLRFKGCLFVWIFYNQSTKMTSKIFTNYSYSPLHFKFSIPRILQILVAASGHKNRGKDSCNGAGPRRRFAGQIGFHFIILIIHCSCGYLFLEDNIRGFFFKSVWLSII